MTPDRSEEARRAVVRGSAIPIPQGMRCSTCVKVIKNPDAPPGFCSIGCKDAKHGELSRKKLRELVLARDRGVCAECNMDTLDLREELGRLLVAPSLNAYQARVHLLIRLGFPRGAIERGETLWECDHRDEQVRAGASTLENAQTLCLAHHFAKTSAFAEKRAEARKGPRRTWPKRRFGS